MSEAAGLSRDRLCHVCGYNLRGLVEPRCPECGQVFDPNARPIPRVPWLSRSRIGWWSAYWQTVFQVMLHPAVVGREIWNAGQLDLYTAKLFRWIIVGQAMSTVAMVVAVIGLLKRVHVRDVICAEIVYVGGAGMFLLLVTSWMNLSAPLLIVETGRLWRQAICFYACAPLALTPLGGLTVIISIVTHQEAIISAGAVGLVSLFAWWGYCRLSMVHVTHRSRATTLREGLTLPLVWILALICGFGVMMAIGGVVDALIH